jgi:maltose O-acetyltransferase
VVVKNVEEMTVVSGNPAEYIKDRKQVHSTLVVESLLGEDYKEYKRDRKNKQ